MNTLSRSRRKFHPILAAAAALAFPAIALAQGQIDAGRANDASNRVGSGGRNAGGYVNSYYSNSIINNGNRVVTGNITMGREFHGNIGYTDPYAFRGNTAGAVSDNFIKNSSGVPRGNTADVPNTPSAFYGAAQTVQQPPGMVLNANRTGYIPPPSAADTRGIQDRRLGVIDLNQPLSSVPEPGQLLTRGSLNPQSAMQQLGILSASPLYGLKELDPQNAADRAFLENLLNGQNGPFNRSPLDPRDIQRMRNELQQSNQPAPNQPALRDNTGAVNTPKASDPFSLNPAGSRGFDAPNDPAVNNQAVSNQVNNSSLSGSGANTEQGTRFNLMGAQKISAQYTELQKRLDQYNTNRKTDADFAREFNAQLKARNDLEKAKLANKNKLPGDLSTLPKLPGTDNPGTDTPDITKPKVKKPKPLKVTTLAQGVRGEGLSGLLKKAETLMKEGKYASALDQYENAEVVTPNNPLIWLGRANAELGAGFFLRADGHLRQAFTTDKALLMGQYDLTGMLGEARLTKLVTELKDLANKDDRPTAVFLLAYIAYNTGHELQALGYLDLAEKRAGAGQADYYKLIREHWALPDRAVKPEPGAKPDAGSKPDAGIKPQPAKPKPDATPGTDLNK